MFQELDSTFLCDLSHYDSNLLNTNDDDSVSFIDTFIKECIDESITSTQLPIIPTKTKILSKPIKKKSGKYNTNKNKYMIKNDNIPIYKKRLSEYDTDNILPDNYIPIKGMGRKKQLQNMTQEQITADSNARLLQNRQSAKDCRKRKKVYIHNLEKDVLKYERKFIKQDKEISALNNILEVYKSQLLTKN